MHKAPRLFGIALATAAGACASAATCEATSASTLTPVLELYTSEGCSSCPPADKWLSGLKAAAARGHVVAQAFHVGYWDDIGWVDRFAAPVHTQRQRDIAAANGQRGIYTPQLVRNGRDWRDYGGALAGKPEAARAAIQMRRTEADAFEATVVPEAGVRQWTAYWTVTEHGHASKVKAGENAGAFLQHDFVVRQYVPVGHYEGKQALKLRAVPGSAQHPRQVNLVVAEPRTGRTLQALSLACSAG
jgi:hypothetical protein